MTTRSASPAGRWEGFGFGLLAVLSGTSVGLLVGYVPALFIIAAAFGLGAVIATVARPEWGLWLLVFITYTRFSDVLVHSYGLPSIAQPFILLLLGIVLLRWRLYSQQLVGWGSAVVLIGGYGLVCFASLVYATDVGRAQEMLIGYIKDALIAIVVVLMCKRVETVRIAIWALIVSGIFMGTITVVQFLTGSFTNDYWGFGQASVENIVGRVDDYRIAGPIGDPNYYAQLLIVIVPVALDRFIHERSISLRLCAGWGLAVCVLSILFTFSRGGFLAIMIVGLCWVLRRPLKPTVVLLSLIIGLAMLPIVPARYTERLTTLVNFLPGSNPKGSYDNSFRGRTSENITALRIFGDHPILGVGRGNYSNHYIQYALSSGLPIGHTLATHNLYLEIAAETGLVGLLAFGAILWAMFRNLWHAVIALERVGQANNAALIEALAIGLIGYLSASMFLHGAFMRSLWLLAGIALALPQVIKYELSYGTDVQVYE